MYFRLYNSKKTNVKNKKNLVFDNDKISIETDSLLKKWINEDGEVFFIIGKLFFQRKIKFQTYSETFTRNIEKCKNLRFYMAF